VSFGSSKTPATGVWHQQYPTAGVTRLGGRFWPTAVGRNVGDGRPLGARLRVLTSLMPFSRLLAKHFRSRASQSRSALVTG
jgi:hypothetical protein